MTKEIIETICSKYNKKVASLKKDAKEKSESYRNIVSVCLHNRLRATFRDSPSILDAMQMETPRRGDDYYAWVWSSREWKSPTHPGLRITLELTEEEKEYYRPLYNAAYKAYEKYTTAITRKDAKRELLEEVADLLTRKEG